MRKRKRIAIVIALAMTVCVLGQEEILFALAEGSEENGVTTFHRVITATNDGLVRYRYEDEEGSEIIPVSASQELAGSSRKRATALPSSYDPRGTDTVTPIRDQEDTGACWAFGAIKSLEGSVIAQGLMTAQETDLSENHLAWYTYHQLTDTKNPLFGDYMTAGRATGEKIYNLGGNAEFAQYILANRWGAAQEADAPFAEAASMAAIMEQADDSLRFRSAVQMTESNRFDTFDQYGSAVVDRDEVKQAILEQGAVDVSLYYDTRNLYDKNGITSMYQNTSGAEGANHCVTIVGWDDSFRTFLTQPSQSGAWLIANSYGEEAGSMGGYLWVSYYDTSLCEYYTFEGVQGDTYENCFQYDGIGWGNGYISSGDISLANTFTNQESSAQQIRAVSFYTYADDQTYDIDIYRNLGAGGPEDGEWVARCHTTGTAEHPGYHTVTLQEPIAVAAGEKFSAVVTFHPVNGETYALMEGESDRRNGLYYSSASGQSYVYLEEEGEWIDNSTGSLGNNNNVCVKAFSNGISEEEYQEQQSAYVPMTPPPRPTPSKKPSPTAQATGGTSSATSSPSQNEQGAGKNAVTKITVKAKLTIGKGESVALSAKTSPASGKATLRYSSSNKKVAAVSAKGVVTGKKKGTAKVTVTAPSGVKKKVTVQVKKAPSSVKITGGKHKLKKGKSTRLRVKLSTGSASYRIRYRSTNPKIATVSATGKVKAKKQGTTRIQVKSFNGKKATIRIKVV